MTQATAVPEAGNPRARRTPVRRELPLHQWCIDETYVSEVLTLPANVTLDEITFRVGFSFKGVVSNISSELRELGVTYIREPSTNVEAQGLLTGARTTIERNAKEICRKLHLDYRKMRVSRMKVSHGGTECTFTRMTKKMAGEEGKIKLEKVLGLALTVQQTEDAGVLRLVRAMSADRVSCRYLVQPTHTVICSR